MALQNDPKVTHIDWMSSSSHVGRNSIRVNNDNDPTIWSKQSNMVYRPQTTVPATTIDKILAPHDEPFPFMKLDLEGADIIALFGATQTLEHRRPVVAFENASKGPDVHGYSIQDISNFFTKYGYVGMNYVGQPLSFDSWFDFYEAWAIPGERLAQTASLIKSAIDSRI